MKAIVIGGGIIGASTAFRLAQAGAEVTLLEAGRLAGGTSGTSFAWMNANNKAPHTYHLLNVGGMAEHARLGQELGTAPWLHVDGNAVWTDPVDPSSNEPAVPVTREPIATKLGRLREWGYPFEVLTPVELREIQPEVRVHEGVERVAYFPTEGWIDAPLLVASLARAAERHRTTVLTGQEVIELIREGDWIVGVRTAAGDLISADVVVSCAGRWTDQIMTMAGVALPMAPTPGLLVTSTPVATTLRGIAQSSSVNVRPAGGSRVLMASFEHDRRLAAGDSPSTLATYAGEILERARIVLPDLARASVESYVVGVRSIPEGGFPVVGPVPGLEGLYVIASHSGVTMGPLLGRLAAREILHGDVDSRLFPYRPSRLIA
ncbi:MAG TPA: FAD-binding oxidoreductase [Thermomicrobiales bacterium]|nr:FAD-binding oxidoreductase [Thermomicrobiales bacterium]